MFSDYVINSGSYQNTGLKHSVALMKCNKLVDVGFMACTSCPVYELVSDCGLAVFRCGFFWWH